MGDQATSASRNGRAGSAGATDADDCGSPARAAFELRGGRWTPLLETVCRVLPSEGRPLSAYAVADACAPIVGRRLFSGSAYRLLALLEGAAIVRRVETAKGYLANPTPGEDRDRLVPLCRTCGRAVVVPGDDLGGALRAIAAAAGFTPSRLVMEVVGTCDGCRCPSSAGGGPDATR